MRTQNNITPVLSPAPATQAAKDPLWNLMGAMYKTLKDTALALWLPAGYVMI